MSNAKNPNRFQRHADSYAVGSETFTLQVKRPEHRADHLPTSGAKIKAECSYTFSPHIPLRRVCMYIILFIMFVSVHVIN